MLTLGAQNADGAGDSRKEGAVLPGKDEMETQKVEKGTFWRQDYQD